MNGSGFSSRCACPITSSTASSGGSARGSQAFARFRGSICTSRSRSSGIGLPASSTQSSGRCATLRVNGLYRHGYMIVPEVADEAARFAAALLDGRIGDADAFADWRRAARWSELFREQRAREPA